MCNSLSHSTAQLPGPQGCEKLHSPFGLSTFQVRTTFSAVRLLENQKCSNEMVGLLAPETQL